MVQKINEDGFEAAVAADIAVVDFFATWCGPCKMLGPVLEDISEEMTDVKFYKIDIDDNESVAGRYNIMSIPAVGVFKNGELAGMSVGFKDKNAMSAYIKEYI